MLGTVEDMIGTAEAPFQMAQQRVDAPGARQLSDVLAAAYWHCASLA